MGAQRTVLTVDDDSSIRILIKSALARHKEIRVIEATDGLDGLDAIRKHKPDLVILDVMMPRQNGIETLCQMREDPQMRDIPVIMLTGVKDRAKLETILEQNITDFVPKPFVVENLREKVHAALFPG